MNPEEIKGLVDELRKLQGQFEGAASANELKSISDRMTAIEVKLARPGAGATADDSVSEAKAAFATFLRTGELTAAGRKALVQNTNGELLVTAEVEAGILAELREATFIEGLCESQSISKNRSKAHKLTGVVTGFGKLELGDAAPADTLTAGEQWIHVEDLNGLAKVGVDELEDADVDIEGHISTEFGFSMADDIEAAVFTGTGHSNKQFDGILENDDVDTVEAATPGEVTADDIITLIHSVPRVYRKNGTLVVNDATILTLRLAKDSTGRYMWEPSMQAGEPPRFAGVPVMACNAVPAVVDGVPAKVAVFGDFRRGYKIVTRKGVAIKRLEEKYALEGMIGYLATMRKGGGVTRPNALRTLTA